MIGQIVRARLVKGKVWQVRRVSCINSIMNSKPIFGVLFRLDAGPKILTYVIFLCNDLAYVIAHVNSLQFPLVIGRHEILYNF